MRPSRRPIRVENHGNNYQEEKRVQDPFTDVQLERILKELSFIRIQIDEISLTRPNPFIQKLNAMKQLFGFQLEYQFPCLEVVSRALRATVRIPNRTATSTKIEFRHKRVVLLTMHEDQVAHWQRAKLNIHLLVQMEAAGKFTTRPLARCSIPIYELLIAPYLICRDFDFIGDEFEGTGLIRIDLGTRVKTIMEKLEKLRGTVDLEKTFVVRENGGARTRSRSSSRCRSHRGSSSTVGASTEDEANENLIPKTGQILREMGRARSAMGTGNWEKDSSSPPMPSHLLRPHSSRSSNSSSRLGSDSVFASSSHSNYPSNHLNIPRNRKCLSPTNVDVYNSASDFQTRNAISEEVGYSGRKCTLEITVHEATGLPPVEDQSGRVISPSAYISILGREGELHSEVIRQTRQPKWNWTARFQMSSERRNLVVKVLHRGLTGDKALGFVTLTLPVNSTRRAVFEITDVSRMNKFSSEVPMLVMSIQKMAENPLEDEIFQHEEKRERIRSSPEPIPILETSEELAEKMRKNMAELGFLMAEIHRKS
ncbi:unnamed protein product [Caenorhabditis angaria]|uniref:C2 domain-containing protein n=1 Tax=Caenorhabditis angaria TaxID=860376 RepID=A0A9P1N1P3_9PELO|nr:unnamed protein product [Caenorhabditis angaria]